MTSTDALNARADLVWRVDKYGATYAAARADLVKAISPGRWPVVHCGSPEAVEAVERAGLGPWLTVELWATREETEARLRARNPHDVAERLAAWDATPRAPLALRIDTTTTAPKDAAAQIAARLAPRSAATARG